MNGSGWFPAALPEDPSKRGEGEELWRVRRRWQKGSPERIETYLGGAPWRETQDSPRVRGLWSMDLPCYTATTLPRFLFRPHCPPDGIWQPFIPAPRGFSRQDKQVLRVIDLPQPGICICYANTVRGARVDRPNPLSGYEKSYSISIFFIFLF